MARLPKIVLLTMLISLVFSPQSMAQKSKIIMLTGEIPPYSFNENGKQTGVLTEIAL